MNTDMTARISSQPRWSTSAFAAESQPAANDSSALGDHLNLCRSVTGRLFAVRCGVDAVHRFLAPRLVTTLVVVLLLVGAGVSVV